MFLGKLATLRSGSEAPVVALGPQGTAPSLCCSHRLTGHFRPLGAGARGTEFGSGVVLSSYVESEPLCVDYVAANRSSGSIPPGAGNSPAVCASCTPAPGPSAPRQQHGRTLSRVRAPSCAGALGTCGVSLGGPAGPLRSVPRPAPGSRAHRPLHVLCGHSGGSSDLALQRSSGASPASLTTC